MGIRERIKKAWEYIKGIGAMLEPDDKDYVAEAHAAGLTASQVKTLLNADSDTVKLAASTFGDGRRRRKTKVPLDFDEESNLIILPLSSVTILNQLYVLIRPYTYVLLSR